jgi:hypothetical protein
MKPPSSAPASTHKPTLQVKRGRTKNPPPDAGRGSAPAAVMASDISLADRRSRLSSDLATHPELRRRLTTRSGYQRPGPGGQGAPLILAPGLREPGPLRPVCSSIYQPLTVEAIIFGNTGASLSAGGHIRRFRCVIQLLGQPPARRRSAGKTAQRSAGPPYRRDMPAKRPGPEDTVTARRVLLDGLARDADISQLISDLAPLHPRDNTFPGEVFLRVAADALDLCRASRADPLPLGGLREAVPARGRLPRPAEREAPVHGAGRISHPRRDRTGPAR